MVDPKIEGSKNGYKQGVVKMTENAIVYRSNRNQLRKNNLQEETTWRKTELALRMKERF